MPNLRDAGFPRRAEHASSDVSGRKLEIQVIFTTLESTRAALQTATRLAHDLDAQVRLVATQVVAYPLPLDRPPVPVALTKQRLGALAASAAANTRVHLLLCRDKRQALQGLLSPRSLLVVGGQRRWWPTAERRLARWLEAEGHSVLFTTAAATDAGAGPRPLSFLDTGTPDPYSALTPTSL
jgi:hypothetical protein